MKQVNFITTLSPQKQYAIRRWFWATFFLVTVAVAVSMFFIVPQLLMYISLQKEVNVLRGQTKQYVEHSKQRDALKTEHELIRVRTRKIDRYTDVQKNPYAYIAVVMQACGDGVTLEALRFNKKNCEITIICPTSEHATVFIKRLSASELFTGVKLVSLQHEGQGKQLRCVIKSMIA